jgi:hypothetical protein
MAENYYAQKDAVPSPSHSHMSQDLCSRLSEAGGLEDQFRDAAEFLIRSQEDRHKRRISVLLDEIGLGNLNPWNPLKVIHAVQDRGIEIRGRSAGTVSQFIRLLILETSNYALDFTIQNRGLLHCSAVPEDDEL